MKPIKTQEAGPQKGGFSLLAQRHHVLYDVIAAAILILVCFTQAFAGYTSRKTLYTVSGIEFLTGKTIAGGTVQVQTNLYLMIIIGLVLAIVAIALLFPKLKTRVGTFLLSFLSFALIVVTIMFSANVKDFLDGAKQITSQYGTTLIIIIALLVIARCLHILSRERILSTLDFMVLPGLAYVLINNYIPMFGILIAFKKDVGIYGPFDSPWAGLDNFKYLLSTSDAWIITRNTLLYNLAFIVVGLTCGMVIGICLNAVMQKLLQRFYQTTILLPQLISMVIVAYIVYAFLSNETGLINNSILNEQTAINFYSGEGRPYWPFFMIFIQNWKMLGYSSVIFLSSIISIDKNLYEAARVDGAGNWKQITTITIPMLKPTLFTIGMLQIGRIFYSDFGLFYLVPMDSGTLYEVTNTVDTYVYRSLMVTPDLAKASAASTFQALVGFAIVLIVNMIVRKTDRENAMF